MGGFTGLSGLSALLINSFSRTGARRDFRSFRSVGEREDGSNAMAAAIFGKDYLNDADLEVERH